MYVCMYVCMYAWMHVCMYLSSHLQFSELLRVDVSIEQTRSKIRGKPWEMDFAENNRCIVALIKSRFIF